jgi:hypothetical protein
MNMLHYRAWIKYISVQYELIHSFDVKWDDGTYKNGSGWGKPDKKFLGLDFRYLWKNMAEPLSFDDFCSAKYTNTWHGLNYWLERL